MIAIPCTACNQTGWDQKVAGRWCLECRGTGTVVVRSSAQNERQKLQYRDDGRRYAKVNPCQGCGKSAGVEYYSHPLTDGEWKDEALCLCKKCGELTYEITDLAEYRKFQKKNGGG